MLCISVTVFHLLYLQNSIDVLLRKAKSDQSKRKLFKRTLLG